MNIIDRVSTAICYTVLVPTVYVLGLIVDAVSIEFNTASLPD